MTNPDREELVKLADRLERFQRILEGARKNDNNNLRVWSSDAPLVSEAATALRRLASSDGAMKVRELAWREPAGCFSATSHNSTGNYNIEDSGPNWSHDRYHLRLTFFGELGRFSTLEVAKAAAQADYEARIKSALITAPPEDAGMREALDALEAEFKGDAIYSPVYPGRKMTRTQKKRDRANLVMDAVFVLRQALTAPGATTKSDGGAKAGSSPILASKEDQHSDTHGMMPVGDNAANVGSTEVGPSDPSPARSEVTVRMLASVLLDCPAGSATAMARALLDQFEIRRK